MRSLSWIHLIYVKPKRSFRDEKKIVGGHVLTDNRCKKKRGPMDLKMQKREETVGKLKKNENGSLFDSDNGALLF